MKLVAKNGRLLEDHPTTFNEEQLNRFKEAIHWYEKATEKISRRYDKGMKQGKDRLYTEAVAKAVGETEEIEKYYKLVINGDCTIGEFKERIKVWFFKVKEGMDDADVAFRKTGALFADYEDRR